MAFLDYSTLRLNLQSLMSSMIFYYMKNLPTKGISTSSLRQSNLRVLFEFLKSLSFWRSISTGLNSSQAQGMYLFKKLAVNRSSTPSNTKKTAFNIEVILNYYSQFKQKTIYIRPSINKKFFYHLMYREQVYNAAGWTQRQPSPLLQASRKLNRGIHRNLGLIDTSRKSNPSNSLRMKRTEVSGDRSHHSRDRQQNSGVTSQAFNDSYRRLPRSIGSMQSLIRHKMPRDRGNYPLASSRSGRNIVQNLYMLTNDPSKYIDKYQKVHAPNHYQEQFSRRQRFQKNQRYQKIAQRRPEQSPRVQQYPQRNSRNDSKKERYQDRDVDCYPTRNKEREHPEDRYEERYSKGQERYQNRAPTPTRSILRSRKSRQKNVLPQQQFEEFDRNYKKIGRGSRDPYRNNQDHQLRRLQDKYYQNVYELNSPKKHKTKADKYYREKEKYPPSRSKEKGYAVEPRNYGNDDRVYPEQRPYIQKIPKIGYGREYDDRDRYRDERDLYRDYERQYEQNEADIRKRKYQVNSGYSGKNKRHYYYEDQIPSTTAGLKTLPETSRYDSVSDASIPINSIGSQRQIPKNTAASQVPQKNSLKLDRPRDKQPKNNKRQRFQNRYDESNIQNRLQKNKVHLKERKADRWDDRNKKTIEEKYKTQDLPCGSVFLPVESKKIEKNEWADDILQKVIVHLQSLNLIADYTKDFKKMYENVQPWQVLIFLTYKKFYIERTKAVNILKPPEPKKAYESTANLQIRQNPYTLPYSKISDKEIEKFCTTRQCLALVIELQAENIKIRNALRNLYNLYIQKSGEHVNMLDCDNFSDQIFRLMKEQIDGICQNLQEPQLVLPTKLRMGKIIKVGLLIAFLNGKYIKNFPQIIIHEDIIKVGKRETLREDNIVELFMDQFKKVIKN